VALLGLTLAANPALAQARRPLSPPAQTAPPPAPAPPSEEQGGTVFFPGILVRPSGRPASLNEAAPQPGPPAPQARPEASGEPDRRPATKSQERRRPPHR
jgi:hypothetical protein